MNNGSPGLPVFKCSSVPILHEYMYVYQYSNNTPRVHVFQEDQDFFVKFILYCPDSGVILDSYEDNAVWELENGIAEKRTGPYGYDRITFTFKWARKHRFYVLNYLVPPLLVSILTFGVYLLPCNSGDKIGLGMNVLLALSVYQLIIMESIPANSDQTPVISESQ